MAKTGLCSTCVQFDTCFFVKEPTVWQCEEFSSGSNHQPVFEQVKVRRVIREEVTESE